jgi:hypothetical protein
MLKLKCHFANFVNNATIGLFDDLIEKWMTNEALQYKKEIKKKADVRRKKFRQVKLK